jgi:formate--tetrahydrofolate ligase
MAITSPRSSSRLSPNWPIGRAPTQAERQLESYERNGFGTLPVCIAKTHLSISADPALKGAPSGHTLHVREVRASVGAGFVYPICGDMTTMPGLGATPAASRIDFDDRGEIVGLS